MNFLKISVMAMIAMLAGSGEAAAMASRHHHESGQGGNVQVVGSQDSRPVSLPEPGTLILTSLGIGAGALGAFWRRARRHVTKKQRDPKP